MAKTPLLSAVQLAVHNRAAIELQLAEIDKLASKLSVILDVNDTESYWRGDK